MQTATIYAIQLGSGGIEFACAEHIHAALDELKVNEAIISTGEAAAAYDCQWGC